MDQERIWRVLCRLLGPAIRKYMGLDMEPLPEGGPYLIICNHVTNLDPVMLALASPGKAITYVASENILRLRPRLRAVLFGAFSLIARRKGASGAAAALSTVRALRKGKNVCIFAEGETSWNGLTGKIHPGTAPMIKASGSALVTYRIHGGYFTFPRWADGLRRGKVRGMVAGIHSAEELGGMDTDEITALVEREISEDAFAAQKKERVPYRSKKRAESLSSLLFLCPRCRAVGTLRGKGSHILCSCGLDVSLDECLLPRGDSPFGDLCEWDRWQSETFIGMLSRNPDMALKEEGEDYRLYEVLPGNIPALRAMGSLGADGRALWIGRSSFSYSGIREMALMQKTKLAFSCGDRYYEIHSPRPLCLHKYLYRWQLLSSGDGE
ncbi:MAG: 1-acyl-sn-glycerol-3-phosphate acyltransferase [Clostridia bacterium]|nr:1-acyl-sn-glycerol-3-phosphate acyltransferase [Clostridia bacterium]